MVRRIVLIVILVGAVAGGGYYAYTRLNASKTSATASLQTTVVSTGTLTASVAASGQLASPQTGNATWGTTGIVGKVDVKVGDVVTANQVLMEIDQSKLDTSVIQAQASLLTDQQTLTNLTAPPSQAAVAADQLAVVTASQAITTAQRALRNALNPAGQSLYDAVSTAKVAVDQASATAQLATVSQSVQDYTNNYWLTDFYWKRYQDLQAKYTANPIPENATAAANAYSDYKVLADKQAQRQLTFSSDQEAKNQTLTQAQSAYGTAVNNLNSALAGPDPARVSLDTQQLAVAQANYNKTQDDLATLQAGASAADVAAAKARIAVDQGVLAKLKVLAPFGGTVVAVSTTTGDAVTPGTVAVQLADLHTLQVAVSVSEIDVSRIKLGQEVDLSLDAVSGKTFTGTVASIGYLGTTTQGVVNFPVTVVIANPDPTLKPGMTASAAVVTDKKANVLLVPNRAIHVVGGQRTVTVLFEGQQIPVQVQVGLTNDTNSEITGGQLKDGDTIVLNATTAASTTGGRGGFGGGFGGGGGPVPGG
jgi:HlyD family secretion protein